MVQRLSQCTKLYEFRDFLNKVKVNNKSWGHKFTYTNNKGKEINYTMNQIVQRFAFCVKNSIGNEPLVNELLQNVTQLTVTASPGCKILQVLGNFWYKLTHFPFDKTTTLDQIRNHAIIGRQDLTSDNIHAQDANGVTILNNVLRQNKNYKDLYAEVKEMHENGVDFLLRDNNLYRNSVIMVGIEEAEKGNTNPLRIVLELLTPDEFKEFTRHMSYKYRSDLKDETKLLFVIEFHKRYENCVDILADMQGDNHTNFLLSYIKFLKTNPKLRIDNSVTLGGGLGGLPLDEYIGDLSDADQQFIKSRYKFMPAQISNMLQNSNLLIID